MRKLQQQMERVTYAILAVLGGAVAAIDLRAIVVSTRNLTNDRANGRSTVESREGQTIFLTAK